MSLSDDKIKEIVDTIWDDFRYTNQQRPIPVKALHRKQLDAIIAGLILIRSAIYKAEDAGYTGTSEWTYSNIADLEVIYEQVEEIRKHLIFTQNSRVIDLYSEPINEESK